ncbi:helix-turn-helix domain-containing protein [Pararcticibacter amylolyticus]|uniref:XRE family transcriptional regulator n=1 Tax=Pararcticibacter amylolyticus TaxID=2173175 RepID=A0A2U2PGY4_9SPHI|nr:helix-turn-helix transcriptional regulator [Pararcticibacter amylolyticus]PWG80666.1 XRE family transcriptional regulator [Pararcticibacter amylolyticus]
MNLSQKSFRTKLGKRIQQLREDKNLEQGELAAIIGKDKQFINRYERQGANPTAYILVQIAEALNASVDQLLDFSNLEE